MGNTMYQDIIDSFESSFRDKSIIPSSLEIVWLKKAIGQYNEELNDDVIFDVDSGLLSVELTQYQIDCIAQMMKVLYQEREVSKVNKRVSIVSKDLSIDGNNGSKTAAKNELEYCREKLEQMLANLKPTAYV